MVIMTILDLPFARKTSWEPEQSQTLSSTFYGTSLGIPAGMDLWRSTRVHRIYHLSIKNIYQIRNLLANSLQKRTWAYRPGIPPRRRPSRRPAPRRRRAAPARARSPLRPLLRAQNAFTGHRVPLDQYAISSDHNDDLLVTYFDICKDLGTSQIKIKDAWILSKEADGLTSLLGARAAKDFAAMPPWPSGNIKNKSTTNLIWYHVSQSVASLNALASDQIYCVYSRYDL